MDERSFDPGHHWRNSRYCFCCRNCTKFVQLILMKIIIVATRCQTQILRLKCTKFDFGWGCAPDPAGGPYSAPQIPSWWEGVGCSPSPRTQPPLSTLRASPLLSVPGSFSQIVAPESKY